MAGFRLHAPVIPGSAGQSHLCALGGCWREIANARAVAAFHLTAEFTEAAATAENNRICAIVAAA